MRHFSSLLPCYFTFVPMHPLLIATLFLILGIGWQSWLQHSWFIIGTVILMLITALSLYTQKTRYLFFFTTFVLGGLLYTKQHTDHNKIFLSFANKPLACIATVISEEKRSDNSRIKQMLIIQIEKIYPHTPKPGHWYTANAYIQMYLAQPTNAVPGDTLAITGISIKKAPNESFERYLIKEGFAASICLPQLHAILLSRPQLNIRRTLWALKTDLLYRIKEKLSSKTFALFSSIFLGNKQMVKKEMNTIKDYYKTWGISHHLARSGLHLVIFIALWGLLLNLLALPFMLKQLTLLFICFLYFLLSWTSISFMRAFFTFILYKTCTFSKISSNTVHILSIVTFITLICNPSQLFFLDFQLSFGLTGALAWFNLILQTQKRVLGQNC